MGFSHCDTGAMLAEAWKIPHDLVEVIELHHTIGDSERGGPLVALVHLCDLLCRQRGMGYGYTEVRLLDFADEPGWLYLVMKFSNLLEKDLLRFKFALGEYVEEVGALVSTVFAG
jgi:hypothetical protein